MNRTDINTRSLNEVEATKKKGTHMKEGQTAFVLTKNRKQLLSQIQKTIDKNDWLFITGEVGSGKSDLLAYAYSQYIGDPSRYVVLTNQSFQTGSDSRINMLMKRIIHAIAPDEHIPGDIETRYYRLQKVLIRAVAAGKKVILFYDEAQDLNEATIRELKKLHELRGAGEKHLFSIIAFAKYNARLENILDGVEIGFRVRRVHTAPLTKDEVLHFLSIYNIEFPQDPVLIDYFFQRLGQHSPLGAENIAYRIQAHRDFTGTLNKDILRDVFAASRKDLLQTFDITHNEIAERVYRDTGIRTDRSTVTKVVNEKTQVADTKTSQAIIDATNSLIKEKSTARAM